MYILGISAYYHDSAAALIKDGEIIAAAQEERFSRVKFDSSFPSKAVNYCLEQVGISMNQVDLVSYYEKPWLKQGRILYMLAKHVPGNYQVFHDFLNKWKNQGLFNIGKTIRENLGYNGKIVFNRHHESHQSAAFFPSPYQEAAIVTIDGIGEWDTLTIGVGSSNQIKTLKRIVFPDSVGLLYGTFTRYCGFRINYDEYKLMGLAPYGEPAFLERMLYELVDIKDDGSFKLNTSFFDYTNNNNKPTKNLIKLLGAPPRLPENPMSIHYMNVAASIQKLTEKLILGVVKHARQITGQDKLVMAGGVTLNCVANGLINKEKIFKDIWIQPAAGDAGGALGTALYAYYSLNKHNRSLVEPDAQKGSLLGPEFNRDQIKECLDNNHFEYEEVNPDSIPDRIAKLIDDQKIIGLFQSRMEFGPRALGSRSILADARSDEMQRRVNMNIKNREGFRPFAPSVMVEHANEYFEELAESPYMLFTANIKENKRKTLRPEETALTGIKKLHISRSVIPAVTHVDYSARIQTVDPVRFPFYYQVLKAFYRRTGCPVILNTSLNGKDEPILCSPQDAINFFSKTKIDYLFIESFLISIRQQSKEIFHKTPLVDAGNRKPSFTSKAGFIALYLVFIPIGALGKLLIAISSLAKKALFIRTYYKRS